MNFVLRMARREMRASWRRLLFFFVCIAIGVASIVSLRSAIRNFYHIMTGDARAVLTADVQIDSNRGWSKEALTILNRLLQPSLVEAKTETVETNTMIRPAAPNQEGAMMVNLKGIESPYPFYGKFQLSDGKVFSHAMLENHGVLVARPILERLRLRIGDPVKMGDTVFHIRAVIEHEPGVSGGFRMAPRVIMQRTTLEAAGLTGFGSRVRRKILLKMPEAKVEGVVRKLRAELKGELIRVRTYKESEENISEQFTRAENFLSLTGLVILVLGGIGISSVTRVFIEQKKKSIAILKCVGGTGRKITLTYLVQMMALGLSGSLFGIALAKLILNLIYRYYSSSLPAGMSYDLLWPAIAQGLAVGLLITLLFSALPLLRIRHIKPNVLLREVDGTNRWKFDFVQWITGAIVVLGLLLLASWQAGSFRIGLFFIAGFAVTSAALHLSAALLIHVVRRLRNISSFPFRYAVNGLYRPGNQTRVIILAVGLGVFFIVAIQSLRSNLLSELDFDSRSYMANMYLIDIQKNQKDGVEKIVRDGTGEAPVLIPTLRARIFAINGKTIHLNEEKDKRDRDRLSWEYTVTYKSTLDPTEKIVAGKFWNSPSSEPEISIEDTMQGMKGLDLGGTVTFDISGRKITARVTSIRQIDWHNSRTAFYVLFRPGSLEAAPFVYIAAINGPPLEPQRSRFQRMVVDQYPNVTIIDVADIIRAVKKIIRHATLAVSFIGGFVFLCGVLILAGSIAMTKFQRIYEAAVLKTLGAKRRVILNILILEYSVMGIVSAAVGTLAGMMLSYLAGRFIFEIPWHYTPFIYAVGVVATVILVAAVGAIAALDVLNRKPLASLRTQ